MALTLVRTEFNGAPVEVAQDAEAGRIWFKVNEVAAHAGMSHAQADWLIRNNADVLDGHLANARQLDFSKFNGRPVRMVDSEGLVLMLMKAVCLVCVNGIRTTTRTATFLGPNCNRLHGGING